MHYCLKVWGGKMFGIFEKIILCSLKLHLFDQKCNKNSNTVK